MAPKAKVLLHTSVHKPETITFLRLFFASESRTFWSSHEFIEVRSSNGASGNTSKSSG